jgi:glycosyltransferase involved in cell wall biosynthesis
MKKILIITDNLPDQINGVVTTFNNIEIIAKEDGYEFFYINPEQFIYINAYGYPEVKLSFPWGIGKKIKKINPDYIHIATEGPVGLAASLWCWKYDYKFNTSYHTKFPEFLKEVYGIPTWITYHYVRWFHRHSGKVLTTTQTMVDDLHAHGFKTNIIPWTRGVDRNIFTSKLRNVEKLHPPVLLSVGRVSKEKGLDDFCELKYTNAKKIIVGDGPYRNELEEKYPDIEFVGTKTGVELATYYANADVFVFTSKHDTFGIVMIEALAVGTPVAAYPVAGPKDIIQNRKTGYMHSDLKYAVKQCLDINRKLIESESLKWSWDNCWKIFKENLIKVK